MDYLEDYVEVLQILPNEMQRHFTHLKEMDSVSRRTDDTINEIVNKLLKKREGLDIEERKKLVNKLNDAFDESVKISKEKLQITTNAYELVDRHIRRLDNDFTRYEAALAQQKSSGSSRLSDRDRDLDYRSPTNSHRNLPLISQKNSLKKSSSNQQKGHSSSSSLSGSGRKNDSNQKSNNRNRKRKDNDRLETHEEEIDITDDNSKSSRLFDTSSFPIDPNEPTYCHCGQVYFGKMIACDNDECDIKWFHIDCIGLKSLPKGKWFCPNCSTKKNKKNNNSSS